MKYQGFDGLSILNCNNGVYALNSKKVFTFATFRNDVDEFECVFYTLLNALFNITTVVR